MRAPDIAALLFHHRNGDPQATLNLMAAFCRYGLGANGVPVDVAKAMAAIVCELGPSNHIKQHRRNRELKQKIEMESRDRGSREKAYIAVAGEGVGVYGDPVGVERLGQINRDKSTKPLLDFVLLAKEGCAISLEQLAAAQDCIARIRRQLLKGDGKSRDKRDQLLKALTPGKDRSGTKDSRWGALGKSHDDEEHFADVEALRAQGIKPGKALDLVAARTGDDDKKIKTNYHREAFRQRQSFIDTRSRLLEENLRFSKLKPEAPWEATPTIEQIRDSLEKADLIGFDGSVSKVPPKPY